MWIIQAEESCNKMSDLKILRRYLHMILLPTLWYDMNTISDSTVSVLYQELSTKHCQGQLPHVYHK